MPFTPRNIKADVADVGPRFDGTPGLEFHLATAPLELREWDAVRVPPGTWRGYEAGPEGLEILVIGAPHLGENPRDDVAGERDRWTG